MIIHHVAIRYYKSGATIYIQYYGSESRFKHIIFVFHDDALKPKLLRKLLETEGIIINDATTYFFEPGLGIQEDMLELIELLAPINIAENTEMQKAAEEYLRGMIGLEKFKQEVVAYCVAGKLSE